MTAQINTEPLPLGEFSPQLLHLDAVGGLLGFRFLRHGQLFQVQPLLLPVTFQRSTRMSPTTGTVRTRKIQPNLYAAPSVRL